MEKLRFWQIAILLMVIFLIFMAVIIWKADALTHNACEICANKMGQSVTCTTGSEFGKTISRTYYPNYTVVDGVL